MQAGEHSGESTQPSIDRDREAHIRRKRNRATMVVVSCTVAWVIVIGFRQFTQAFFDASPDNLLSMSILAIAFFLLCIHVVYFQSNLCLISPISFRKFGAFMYLAQVILGTCYVLNGGFDYYAGFFTSMVVVAVMAFASLTYGATISIVVGLTYQCVIGLVYFSMPYEDVSVPLKHFIFFNLDWLFFIIVMSVLNGVNKQNKQKIVSLLRAHAEHNDTIKHKNSELDIKAEQLQELNKSLQEMSQRDGLTGIANRRCFNEILDASFLEARTALIEDDVAHKKLCVMMIDVDEFKKFNDQYGHLSGDKALRGVASVLSQVAVGKKGLAARYGGEEFSIILPGMDTEEAEGVACRIKSLLQNLAIPHVFSSVDRWLTVSIGITQYNPLRNRHAESMIADADEALYEAKKRGRNRYQVFEAPESVKTNTSVSLCVKKQSSHIKEQPDSVEDIPVVGKTFPRPL